MNFVGRLNMLHFGKRFFHSGYFMVDISPITVHSRCPAGKIKLHVRPSSQSVPKSGVSSSTTPRASTPMGSLRAPLSQTVTMATTPASLHSGGTRLQLVQQGGTIKGEERDLLHQ